MKKPSFFQELEKYLASLLQEKSQIEEPRRQLLMQIADYIRSEIDQDRVVRLNFICTHNSRRSHLAQIWAAVAAAYYGLDGIETYSGGTEATAFNPRAVAALERAGFQIEDPGGENPRYSVRYQEDGAFLICFSKVFDDPVNPSRDFVAVMTCSDADENCPFIPGVNRRFSLTYEDPKVADGTPEETSRYDERVRQIGREILYLFNFIKQSK